MKIRPRHVAAILLRQYYLMRGSPVRILPVVVWVAIDIILWGFISRYLNIIASSQFDFLAALLGAIIFWDFFNRVMYGVSTAFLEDVWSRNFLNLFTSPLSVLEYLIGLVLCSILTSIAGLLVMLILASLAFGLSFFSYGLTVIPFLTVLFLFGIALGIVAIAMVLRFGPPAEWLVWPIPALLSPFAAVFYPVAVLPRWMQYLARALPPSYVFESMRTLVSGGRPGHIDLLIATGLAVLYVIIACWFFAHVFKVVIREGHIARYSAETVS
ncbi:MAG: ABC transporter permease [Sedimentisphaerales bacterium]|nr:ABC transporter permease [Sedimentisphaerales bacterium]